MARESALISEFSFVNESEMGTLIRSFDWARTPVGEVEGWSSSLRTAVSICLDSAFPMLICWGTELVQFYNDAYIPILGSKHPQALGQRFSDCWSEVWETLEPIFTSVQETSKAVKSEDTRFIIRRYGYDEETYFSVSYSAIRDEVGQIGGILCTVTETTQRVLGDRRLRTLRELAVNTTEARTFQAAGQVAINTLASNRADIPFALLYLLNSQQTLAHRVSETGLAAEPLNLATVDCRQNIDGWAFAQAMQTQEPQFVSNLRSRVGLDAEAQPELPNTALIQPITAQTQAGITGFLVVGLSPYLMLNSEYSGFLDLVALQVATSIANARADEEERKRVEALAELDRAKTTFFSNVSHEFRTPLTLMPLVDDNVDMRDYLQRIQTQFYEVDVVADGETAPNLDLGRSRQAAARRRIDSILESITDGFVALDREWRYIYVNPQAEQLLRQSRAALLGNSVWLKFPDLVGSVFEDSLRRAMSEQVAVDLEAYFAPLETWFDVRLYPSSTGLSIYFRDVSEADRQAEQRKLAEVALRQSEERYRTLFESIDEGFCVIEMLFDENYTPLDYRFLEINPAFEQQTGLKQAVGKTARQLVPSLEDHWFEIYGKVALTGEPLRFANGSEEMNRWFDVYAFRIGQMESRKVAILFNDITERKRIEAEREQILQREQTAREAAENANRIKDEFLAVLSHELRSPLNPILGWTSLLRNGGLDAAKTAYAVETIERNAKLQVQLIEDLLDISRILRGKMSLNVMSVDLGAVICAALETVRLAAVAKSLQIQTTISPTVGTINGDAGRLQQVLWNLLSNAVKFTPQGGQITVALTIAETHAQIQVSDTGKGINPEFLPYIFEHFRQEDGATTRKFGGLGLGLAIARQIVELHGGTVQAESPGVGKGATFTVKLPLLRNEDRGTPDKQIPASLTSPALPLSNVQVLVVDDEIDTRELIAFILEQAGASVTSVPSALAALEVLARFQSDVLVSDVGMPEMDGYMLMQQIRAMSPGKQIPAIALTAYAGESDRHQALAAGFQQHVSKPIEPEMLVAAIVSLIAKGSTAVKRS